MLFIFNGSSHPIVFGQCDALRIYCSRSLEKICHHDYVSIIGAESNIMYAWAMRRFCEVTSVSIVNRTTHGKLGYTGGREKVRNQ